MVAYDDIMRIYTVKPKKPGYGYRTLINITRAQRDVNEYSFESLELACKSSKKLTLSIDLCTYSVSSIGIHKALHTSNRPVPILSLT
jgi:hypothetical protein